jgi:hypothetical protein
MTTRDLGALLHLTGIPARTMLVVVQGEVERFCTTGFGFSAVSLILLQIGFDCAVTHRMTLPGAVAAAAVLGAGGTPLVAVLLGASVAGALLGELFSRLFLIHGDTHVDPPANAIWVMATVIFVFSLLVG